MRMAFNVETQKANVLRPRFIISFLFLSFITGIVLEQIGETYSHRYFSAQGLTWLLFGSEWTLLRAWGNTQRFVFYILFIFAPYLIGFVVLGALLHLLLTILYMTHQEMKERLANTSIK